MTAQTDFYQKLHADLDDRKRTGMYRFRHPITGPQGPLIRIGNRVFINFSSNDYLGLASHPGLLQTFQKAIASYGAGAGSSQLICGHSVAHTELEEALSDFTGRQRSLVFSSGYLANIAIVTALAGRHDFVIEDRLVHASLIDAARLSQARLLRYLHADADHVERLLLHEGKGLKLVLTDGVFSMDGDIAPLLALVRLCRRHEALLLVDDAHGFGVLGSGGGGVLEKLGLTSVDVPVLVGTFGKALGAFGAFVSGDESLIDTLVQKARSYIYTTALPPAIAVTVTHALQLVRDEPWHRQHLQDLVIQFRNGCNQLGINIGDSESAIQPVIIGDAREAGRISDRLYEHGIFIPAIRPPTVPAGTSRLRITLSAAHDEKQVNHLLEIMDSIM